MNSDKKQREWSPFLPALSTGGCFYPFHHQKNLLEKDNKPTHASMTLTGHSLGCFSLDGVTHTQINIIT